MKGKISIFRYCLLACFLFSAYLVFSADRYALVIGNGNYRDSTIASLTNPVNDATDVASALGRLGYNVSLKTNVGLRDMINAIRDFTGNLRRNSQNEGFFWFAGHGLSVRNIHYLLPVDVDPVDDNMIARGSFSVDDLLEEIGNARNVTNLIVIDACRNTLIPGSANRTVGSRGLSIVSADDIRASGNKIVYSTMAGRTAADGVPGSRNSPFAQAFILHVMNPESFDDVFLDIANETLRLTNGDQHPYSMGSFALKSYSLNPQAASAPAQPVGTSAPAQPAGTPAQPAGTPAPVIIAEQPAAFPAPRPADTGYIMDNRKFMNLSLAPALYSSTFDGKGGGLNLTFTFYETYGPYGEFFFIPNSFYFGIDIFLDSDKIEFTSSHPNFTSYYNTAGRQEYAGFIWNLGALWKIRFVESQRFLGHFGLSISFFTAGGYIYDSDDTEIETFSIPFDPGIGINIGISFRITKLVSLDLNIVSQFTFQSREFTWAASDSYLGNFDIYAKNLYPLTVGARVGISFWWPR